LLAVFLIIGGFAAIVSHFAVGEIFQMDFRSRRASKAVSTGNRQFKLSRPIAGAVMILAGVIYLLFHK
jgi:hypothetical protein